MTCGLFKGIFKDVNIVSNIQKGNREARFKQKINQKTAIFLHINNTVDKTKLHIVILLFN